LFLFCFIRVCADFTNERRGDDDDGGGSGGGGKGFFVFMAIYTNTSLSLVEERWRGLLPLVCIYISNGERPHRGYSIPATDHDRSGLLLLPILLSTLVLILPILLILR